MNIRYNRIFSKFLKIWQCFITFVGLFLILIFSLRYIPLSLLDSGPATGGDMGSHFWPLHTLVNYGLPNWTLRVWNPGNLGGEPHLVHYFPFPYIVMAVLAIFVKIELAYNLGTLLPIIFLPFSAFFCTRSLAHRFPVPLFSAGTVLIFLYSESYSMWGGNSLSTLAGQFNHIYALNLLLIFIATTAVELRKKRLPLLSSIIGMCVATSHAYVFIGLPLIGISFVLFSNFRTKLATIKHLFWSFLLIGLWSAWYLFPLVDNAPWTIAFPVVWWSENLLKEVFPINFYPVLFIIALNFLLCFFLKSKPKQSVNNLGFIVIPILGYVVFYFLFPHIGLVDVRAFPQILLIGTIGSAIFLGTWLSYSRILAGISAFPILMLLIWWASQNIVSYPGWLKWNYSGWKSKVAYASLEKIYSYLQGSFSDPRVVFEHNTINNLAGSIRVFEMLPYFTGRATLESLYLQASLLAPAAFLIQSEISKIPSCPFMQYRCLDTNIDAAEARLKLLGIGEIIFSSKDMQDLALKATFLRESFKSADWAVFSTKIRPSLVETFKTLPLFAEDPAWSARDGSYPLKIERTSNTNVINVDEKSWKAVFYRWLLNYQESFPMMLIEGLTTSPPHIADIYNKNSNGSFWLAPSDCKPKVQVDYNKIVLETDCPQYAHFLKFAYHPNWRSLNGDNIFMISPGFIALFPSERRTELVFMDKFSWQVANMLSFSTFLIYIIFYNWSALKKRKIIYKSI